MQKTTKKTLSLLLCLSLLLTGCGSNNGNSTNTSGNNAQGSNNGGSTEGSSGEDTSTDEGTSGEITDFVTYETTARELETLNILYSQNATDLDVLTNCIEGLVSADPDGKLVPAVAESWETTDGGLTWTFKLRNDVVWVDVDGNEMAKCTAEDFITGLEWILNFHKNDAANTSMPIELIKGASEYYEYTKALSVEEGQALDTTKFKEMVGLSAPDEYTLVFTCTTAKPYFDTVATYNCLYPASQALIDKLGVDGFKACDNTNMWYNGCYTMTTYVQNNQKVLTKNEKYWDKDAKLFNTVTIKMVESLDVAYQLYQTGEIHNIDLTESNLTTINASESNEFHDQLVEKKPTKYSFQMHYNYNKLLEDGSPDTNWNTAIANTAFRQAWYYGLELTSWFARTNAINPLKCENNAYTMEGLIYLSDGTEYTQLVKDNLGIGEYNGETMLKYNADKAAQYKAQAMEELTAKGVTFPVEADYYIAASNQTALDTATVLQQAFSDSLGDDFVKLNIKTFVNSFATEIRPAKLFSFAINGWGADYGDPQNYLGQETYGEDNAYYAVAYSNINDVSDETLVGIYQEYTRLVNEANAINDNLDARYKAYAEAETYMIENALVIPCYFEVLWELTHVNDYSKINAMFGIQNRKFKNWETSVDAYTTAQYEEFAAEATK